MAKASNFDSKKTPNSTSAVPSETAVDQSSVRPAAASPSRGKKTQFSADGKNGRKNAPSPEEIRRRAYELYEARGRQHGRDRDDWLEAERELRGRAS